MGIEVTKAGISDTIQDNGRFGFQHLGINPTGVMDATAMGVANALTGNALHEAVLEFAFPAPVLKFQCDALIAISGADFTPLLNNIPIPLNQPVLVTSQSVLKFSRAKQGRWCYLSVRGGFSIPDWLQSKSTHMKAKVGGLEGRKLKKGDVIPVHASPSVLETRVLPWRSSISSLPTAASIRCVHGAEFSWFTKKAQADFLKKKWDVSQQSDRMGYALSGVLLRQSVKRELVSAGVTAGTLQVLPSGSLLALMADHQTTGGYPRIAHVVSADLPVLAQMSSESFAFRIVSIEEAEAVHAARVKELKQLSISCQLKLSSVISQ
jgi:antagonist of KipI